MLVMISISAFLIVHMFCKVNEDENVDTNVPTLFATQEHRGPASRDPYRNETTFPVAKFIEQELREASWGLVDDGEADGPRLRRGPAAETSVPEVV